MKLITVPRGYAGVLDRSALTDSDKDLECKTIKVETQDEQILVFGPNHVKFPTEQKEGGIAANTEQVVSEPIQCTSEPRMAPDFLNVGSKRGFGFQASAHEMQTGVA